MLDRIPKVFISYSWLKQNEAIELATRLRNNRVDAILDVWDLKSGHDKYAFMEQCVTNPEVDKVLMLCDKSYAAKANERSGGVGDETMIISPEIYENEKTNQEKFIPVILEKDENDKPFLPAYLKRIVYIDISGEHYEDGYETLLRSIYDEPKNRKPALGSIPDFLLKEEPASLFPLKDALRKLESNNFGRINEVTARNFINLYLDSLKGFYRQDSSDPNKFLDDFRSMKEQRNYFLAFLKLISESKKFDIGEFFSEVFENIHNTLSDLHFFMPNSNSCNTNSFDIFRLHVWELFLCSITYMLHNKLFSDINKMLVHTYFLRRYVMDERTQESSYGLFCFNTYSLENWLKHKIPELKPQLTPIGHILCFERENYPIYTRRALADTDLFLFQIYDGLNLDITDTSAWYPTCYIYTDTDYSIWQKLKSKKFCEKIFKLFGVNSIDNLKNRISKCRNEPAKIYENARLPAPTIRCFINIQDIGTLP